MRKLFNSFFILLTLLLSGCSKSMAIQPWAIQPWDKGNLARHDMALDPEPQESKLMRHLYQSKEGAFGGYGVGGGGCGCN